MSNRNAHSKNQSGQNRRAKKMGSIYQVAVDDLPASVQAVLQVMMKKSLEPSQPPPEEEQPS